MSADAPGYQRIELRAPAAIEGIVDVVQYLLHVGALGAWVDVGIECKEVDVGKEARHVAPHPVHLRPSKYGRSVVRVIFQSPLVAFQGQGVLIFGQILVSLNGKGVGAGVAAGLLFEQFQIDGGTFLPPAESRVDGCQSVLVPVVGGVQGDGGLEILFRPGRVAGRQAGHAEMVLHRVVGRIVLIQILKLLHRIRRGRFQFGDGIDEDILQHHLIGGVLGPERQERGQQKYGDDGLFHMSGAQCKINAFSLSL